MIFDVKAPILGFETIHKMRLQKIDEIFLRLNSTEENSVVSFTLVNPFALRKYEFEVPTPLKILLELEGAKSVLVANIMVVQTPIELSTVNYLAPLIFNLDKQLMGQVVLDSNKYPHYHLRENILSHTHEWCMSGVYVKRFFKFMARFIGVFANTSERFSYGIIAVIF